jgi:uncharacterized protein with HEPN domain
VTTPRTSADYLLDIAQAAEDALGFVAGYTFDTFRADKKTWNAVVRVLTVLGEAAKRVPQTDRDRSPDIPWRLMTGMRDRLVHDYINVRLDRVWSTVTVDLPTLIPAVRRFRDQLIVEEPPPPPEAPDA